MTSASVLLDAIAEPTRRTIVERLAERPATVSDLAHDLPITRSAVSQHPQILKAAGLVTDRAVGTRRIYTVNPDALAVIRAYFDAFWTRSLDAFRAAAEQAGGSLMPTTDTTSVSTSVEVQAPIERAFHVFTAEIGTWWDDDKHIPGAPLAEMILEPCVGGNIIDRGLDGSECRWATVLAYEPPNRVCFSWDINTRWQIETDPAKASEIEITFTETAPRRTRVVLTHRRLDRHGEGWQDMRDAVSSGWSLTRFAEATERATPVQ